eukprot:75781-Chlamydomonas_euryale.AAC.3
MVLILAAAYAAETAVVGLLLPRSSPTLLHDLYIPLIPRGLLLPRSSHTLLHDLYIPLIPPGLLIPRSSHTLLHDLSYLLGSYYPAYYPSLYALHLMSHVACRFARQARPGHMLIRWPRQTFIKP